MRKVLIFLRQYVILKSIFDLYPKHFLINRKGDFFKQDNFSIKKEITHYYIHSCVYLNHESGLRRG